MPSVRAQIEQGIQSALTQLLKVNGGYLLAVEPHNGELNGGPEFVEEMRQELLGRVPGVLIETGRATYRDRQLQRRRAIEDMDIHLWLVSGSLRSRAARTQGGLATDADPGVYQMLEDVRGILFGNDLGLSGVGRITPVSEGPHLDLQDLTAWELLMRVPVEVIQPAEDADDEDLTELRGRHNLTDDDAANPVVEQTHTLETP